MSGARLRIALAGAALALAIVAVVPEPVHAIPCIGNTDIGPCDRDGEGVADWVNPADNWAGGIGDSIVGRLIGELTEIVAEPLTRMSPAFFDWLVTVEPHQGSLASLRELTDGIALAALAVMLTLAAIHFWASGLSLTQGGDGSAPFEAVTRGVGAALFIAAWPFVYEHAIELSNAVSESISSAAELEDAIEAILPIAAGSGLVAPIIGLLSAITTLAAAIGLILMKIGLTVGLAVLYIGMPLVLVLWVLPSQAWVAHLCLRSFAAVLIVPVVWALGLAAIAAIGANDFTPSDGLAASIMPALIGLFGWIMLIKLAQIVLRVAGSGGSGTGAVLMHAAMITAMHGMRAAGGHGAGDGKPATPTEPKAPPVEPLMGPKELGPGPPPPPPPPTSGGPGMDQQSPRHGTAPFYADPAPADGAGGRGRVIDVSSREVPAGAAASRRGTGGDHVPDWHATESPRGGDPAPDGHTTEPAPSGDGARGNSAPSSRAPDGLQHRFAGAPEPEVRQEPRVERPR